MLQINYDESKLTFECRRKHLLKDSHYFVYLLPSSLILSAEKQSQHPKYHIQLGLTVKIHFILKPNSFEVDQFGILYRDKFKYFFANSNKIAQLKEMMACMAMYKEISDFYQPCSMLGKGGQSRVYLVQRKGTKDQYASKCVEKRYLIEDGGYNGLFNEIQLMQKMNHPKIIHLEELYEGENTFYLILEYLHGQSLHEIMNRRSALFDQEQIQTILRQLLIGVEYMHSQRVMHRDLKPENIMFKNPNALDELKIVDFGLATSLDAETYPYPKCGTPGYVAPEIANLKDLSQKYDMICDLFSVGCIFFKLQLFQQARLTGKELFPGTDYQEILKLNKKCSLNFDMLSMYRAPKEAIDLIVQFLKINPKERINATKALEHEYFQIKFESKRGKFQKASNKYTPVFQTQNFNVKDTKAPQTFTIEDDVVEDENAHQLKIPVMPNIKAFGQFVCKIKPQITPTLARRNFKKFQTTDFNGISPHSPRTADDHKPSFILKTGDVECLQKEQKEHKITAMGQIDEEQDDQNQLNQ